jgi:hypothetical protein
MIHKGKQVPAPPKFDLPHDSEAELSWQRCGQAPETTGQPSYTINVNMMSGYGSDDSRSSGDLEPEILNPLLKGIERSGPDLEAENLESRSGYAGPVLQFTLCGRMKSPDDAGISGEHVFSSTQSQIDQLRGAPTQVKIVWNLNRTPMRSTGSEGTQPPDAQQPAGTQPGGTNQGALAPADLLLTVKSAPATAVVAEKISYQFEIKNKGPADSQGSVFTIALGSAGLIEARASQGQCTAARTTVTCKLGVLAVDGTANVTVSLMPRAVGMLRSKARVYSASPDPDPGNNVRNVIVMTKAKSKRT